MRSSTGAYYVGLDHLRALAALEVFTWHFLHYPKYNELRVAPIPWGFLAEGHIGVSLFMTLSGYIFAKLLSDRDIIYPRFVFNRCVRLLPLLLFVITVVAMKTLWQRGDWSLLSRNIMWGWLRPNLPNGGWSITVEFHFYLILPWLLWSMRRWKRWLWLTLLGAIGVRLALWLYLGSVQRLAFWTIAGRFDQFLLGIYTFELRHTFVKHRWLGAVAVIAYLGYFTWFDAIGGYHSTTKHPLLGSIWIVEPTIEAVLSALLIGSYDQLPVNETSRFSKALAKIGTYSYSIYLLHFFVVDELAKLVHHHLVPLDNGYVALAVSFACFPLVIPLGYLGFTYIESPFLAYRVPYLRPRVESRLTAASPLEAALDTHRPG